MTKDEKIKVPEKENLPKQGQNDDTRKRKKKAMRVLVAKDSKDKGPDETKVLGAEISGDT